MRVRLRERKGIVVRYRCFAAAVKAGGRDRDGHGGCGSGHVGW